MKKTLKGILFLSVLSLMAVGCGKDGGGSSSGSSSNPITTNTKNLSASGKEAFTLAKNWYNGTTEGRQLTGTNVTIQRVKFVYNSASNAQNCEEKKFLGIKYQYCSYSGNSQTAQPELVSTVVRNLNTNLKAKISSKSNSTLKTVFTSSAGTLVNATVNGNVIRLDFSKDNKLVTYVIDKNYHSFLNPVQIMVQSQSEVTSTNTYAH